MVRLDEDEDDFLIKGDAQRINTSPNEKDEVMLYDARPTPDICCASLSPGRALFRYSILLGCCLLTFGSYFAYDIPAAITCPLEKLYDVQNLGYELLYSVYSVPNMILPFCGGWLVDRVFGIRIGGLVFCGLVTVGQIIFALSTSFANDLEGLNNAYYLALAGRVVFGLGGECLSVVQSTYCAKWFAGKELALAFGITLSFSRIGSALNLVITPIIGTDEPWIATWLGALLCGVSVAACIWLALLDKRGDVVEGEKDVKADEQISLSDVLHFPATIWLLYFICITFYVSIFTFITLASSFFTYKFGISSQHAGWITAIPYTLSAFLSPVGGFLVDRVGRSLTWVFAASCLVTLSHSLMLFGEDSWQWDPVVAMTTIGVAYSICAASLWPCVPLIVQQHQLGTAYGLMTSLQNTGLALAPFIVGLLNSAGDSGNPCDSTENNSTMDSTDKNAFNKSMLFFVGCAGVAALLTLVMMLVDGCRGGYLNAPAKVLRAKLAEAETKQKEDLVAQIEEKEEVIVRSNPAQLLAPRSHMHVRNAYLMRVGILPTSISVQTDSRRNMNGGRAAV